MKYRCIVKDKHGNTVTSNAATVTVATKLAITKQPEDFTGAAGSQAAFSVTAQGDGLTYQWQMLSNGEWKNSSATGAKTNKITFNITNAHNGMKYRCIVKDKYGNSVTSNTATITVGTKLAIISQPEDFTGAVGSKATFSIEAEGDDLKYQWQMYTNGEWKNSSAQGAKTSTITFTISNIHDGMQYRCVVTDRHGNEEISEAAAVHVGTILEIVEQPVDYTGAVGSKATISIEAEGDDLKYQWQMYTSGEWKNSSAPGAKTSTITFNISSSHDGMQYRCVVTDGYGNEEISEVATVHVGAVLEIIKQPVDFTGFEGDKATFSIEAEGEGLSYQWQIFTNGEWKNSSASGANTSTITFNIKDSHAEMQYRCVVTDSDGNEKISDIVKVHIVVEVV